MSDSEKLESPISRPVAVPFGTTADHRRLNTHSHQASNNLASHASLMDSRLGMRRQVQASR